MISDELSNANFGFSLRRLGAELPGMGVSTTPPSGGENPEAYQGAS